MTTVELLEQLLRCVETRGDASALLHERVVLERLDGEVLRGRVVVVDALRSRAPGARLEVLARDGDDALRVGLFVEGVNGHLRFTLRGDARDGLLLAITMEPC